jgi:hypothetical protein
MNQTVKDSVRLQSQPAIFEILRRPDGSLDIFRNGELTKQSVPDRCLEDELSKYGICGQEYRATRFKLDELGEARLVFQTGRVKTRLRTKDDSTVKLEGM